MKTQERKGNWGATMGALDQLYGVEMGDNLLGIVGELDRAMSNLSKIQNRKNETRAIKERDVRHAEHLVQMWWEKFEGEFRLLSTQIMPESEEELLEILEQLRFLPAIEMLAQLRKAGASDSRVEAGTSNPKEQKKGKSKARWESTETDRRDDPGNAPKGTDDFGPAAA